MILLLSHDIQKLLDLRACPGCLAHDLTYLSSITHQAEGYITATAYCETCKQKTDFDLSYLLEKDPPLGDAERAAKDFLK